MAKNPLFDTLSKESFPPNFLGQIREFAKTFTGDPQQKVQELLNSGRMSQEDFNRYSHMANQLSSMLGGNSP